MEKRIDLEKRGKNPAQIAELVLDNCRSTSVVGLTEEFCNLEILSLHNVGLTNLKGFPKLPNLKKLELSDNRISGGLNYLSGSPKLTTLNLTANKIESLEALEPLKEFKNLKHLDLFNCEITSKVENYREKVFALLPQLKYLDGFDQEEKEAEESSEEENGTNDKYDGDSDLDEEDEDEENEEDLEEEDEDEEDGEVGLSYLQNSIDEESEGEDYNPDGANDSDVDIEDDADEDEKGAAKPRGQKRKLETDD